MKEIWYAVRDGLASGLEFGAGLAAVLFTAIVGLGAAGAVVVIVGNMLDKWLS